MGNPVIHFDIGCKDRDRSDDFYTQLFGWETTDYGPLSRKINTGSEEGIQGHLTALGHEPHQYVMVYVQVDDIGKTLEKVLELGGEIMVPETDIPGGGRFAWFKDIDGNIIGLIRNQ